MKLIYPLARPNISKKEERNVLSVLRSGTLSIGPFVEEFEKKFAKAVGSKYACAVSSGTAGLHIALVAAGIGEGDEVITSPFSFIASSNSILYTGARPVFVDVDPLTYNIDPSKIEEKITRRTKAIMPVHIFGQLCDMHEIMRIAKKHKLIVIEDACESLKATYRGKQAGTFGQSGVFAFYANKQMTTGEGGMLVTDDKHIYELAKSLRNQGRAPNMQWLDHDRLGFNYRMDEMSAALGVAQLEQLALSIRERKKIAAWYEKHLRPYRQFVTTPKVAPGNSHTYFVYVVQIRPAGRRRDAVIEKLGKRGIGSKPYLPSIHLFSFYKKLLGTKRGDFPISENVSDHTLALPIYVGLTEKDIRRIVATLISIL